MSITMDTKRLNDKDNRHKQVKGRGRIVPILEVLSRFIFNENKVLLVPF